jgi:hypothetical protein
VRQLAQETQDDAAGVTESSMRGRPTRARVHRRIWERIRSPLALEYHHVVVLPN